MSWGSELMDNSACRQHKLMLHDVTHLVLALKQRRTQGSEASHIDIVKRLELTSSFRLEVTEFCLWCVSSPGLELSCPCFVGSAVCMFMAGRPDLSVWGSS